MQSQHCKEHDLCFVVMLMSSLINWLSFDATMDGIGWMVEKLWALIGFERLNPLKYPLCTGRIKAASRVVSSPETNPGSHSLCRKRRGSQSNGSTWTCHRQKCFASVTPRRKCCTLFLTNIAFFWLIQHQNWQLLLENNERTCRRSGRSPRSNRSVPG